MKHVLLGAFIIAVQACGVSESSERGAVADSVADSTHAERAALTALGDSAAADSAAYASLPSRLRADFDFHHLFVAPAIDDTSRALCERLANPDTTEVRKRFRGRWPTKQVAILFVRADRATAALHRVELVRRYETGKQQGYIWDRGDGDTKVIEWTKGGIARETHTLPEGTPAPRALRGLGRKLLALPCP